MAVLLKLQERQIIEYHAKNNDSTVAFNEIREDDRTINRVSKYLEEQNSLKKSNLKRFWNMPPTIQPAKADNS